MTRYRWLEREARSVELLSSREKLMAGLPNFATYFGRDMMMAALMMQPIWSAAMPEHVLASVLRKLSPAGDVSHEEALGGQAIRENAQVYDSVMGSYFAHAARGAHRSADSALAVARAILANLQRVRENYHMMDDELQLPVLAARYLTDSRVSPARRRAFLLERSEPGSVPRVALLLRELALVAKETAPYVTSPSALHLIGFPKLDDSTWRSASWRDSRVGYGNGRFAMDINVIWAPRALAAIGEIASALRTLGWHPGELESLAPEIAGTPLATYLREPARARHAAEVWESAERYFRVTLGRDTIAARIRSKLAWLPAAERRYWEMIIREHGDLPDSLSFLALALDSAGRPIPIVNTDPATRLFLGEAIPGVETGEQRPDALLRDVVSFVLPYPVGLFVDGLGPLVANDAYASPAVWTAFRNDPYHSPRVVWGREVNLLLLGLARAIEVAREGPATLARQVPSSYVAALESAFRRTLAAVNASGFKHSELWSYRIEGGRLLPTRYGTSSDVQLWSTTDLAVQFVLSRLETGSGGR